jgi:hypothetical protein
LEWLEEVNALYRNNYFTTEKALYGKLNYCPHKFPGSRLSWFQCFPDWINYSLNLPEVTFRRVSAHAAAAEIFISLGNTAAALQKLWAAGTSYASTSDAHRTPRIMDAANQSGIVALSQLRHPDASLTAKMEIKDPSLSVLGSWLKISVKAPPSKILHRYSFSSFIWKSKVSQIIHGYWRLTSNLFSQVVCTSVADEKMGSDLSIVTFGASV